MDILASKVFWIKLKGFFILGLALLLISAILADNPENLLKQGPQKILAQEWYEGSNTGSNDSQWEPTASDFYQSGYQPQSDWANLPVSEYNPPSFQQTFVPEINYQGSATGNQDSQWEPTASDFYQSGYQPQSDWYNYPAADFTPHIDFQGSATGNQDSQWEPTASDFYQSGYQPQSDWWNYQPSSQWEPTASDFYQTGYEPQENWWDQPGGQTTPQAGPTPVYYPPAITGQPIASGPAITGQPITSQPISQPQTQTWEGPGCWGNHSVWGVWTLDGKTLLQNKQDFGVKAGECNNPYPQPQTIQQQPAVINQTIPAGGTTSSFGASRTFTSSDSNPIFNFFSNPFTTTSPSSRPSNNLSPLQAVCNVSSQNSIVGQAVSFNAGIAGGSPPYKLSWGGNDLSLQRIGDNNNTAQTVIFNQPGIKSAVIRVRDSANQEVTISCPSVSVGNAPTPLPTPPPPAPTILPTPLPTVLPSSAPVSQPGNVACPAGTVQINSMSGSSIVCVTQNQNQINNQSNNQSVNIQNPSPVIIQTTGSGTVNPTTPQVILAAGAAPIATASAKQPVVVQVQGDTNIKELPKTGIPLAAWALVGLTPIGLRLRKLGRVDRDNLTANSIWMDRQLKS